MEDTELDSSELGTQEYWNDAYAKEIINFEENGDQGDVWFGEDSALRIIKWICNCDIDKNTPVIDLGCGNGFTLRELAKEGFTNLLGVDYCPGAITLAEKVSKNYPQIRFQVLDITEDDVTSLGKFGVIHDKGTYDAVGLNPESPRDQRMKYMEQVRSMLADDGFFILTSCNWTDDELIKHFMEKMKLKCVIPSPLFKFGGKVGSVVSSVVFTKK